MGMIPMVRKEPDVSLPSELYFCNPTPGNERNLGRVEGGSVVQNLLVALYMLDVAEPTAIMWFRSHGFSIFHFTSILDREWVELLN